jgi:transcriptional regulator with XRE-family HTH domain
MRRQAQGYSRTLLNAEIKIKEAAGQGIVMTIKDIAHIGGVSIATVSRVLNNQCAGRKTREKILNIIEKHDFYPNTFARYLGRRNKAKFPGKCKRLQ